MRNMNEGLQLFGEYTITIGDKENPKSVHIVKNKVVLAGRALFAEQVIPSPSAPCTFTHITAGNGTTPWNDTQTQLVNETLRGAIISQGSADGVSTCSVVFPAGTATGIYSEFGVFLNATGVANSGILFSRILYSAEISASDPLFIDYRITLSNA